MRTIGAAALLFVLTLSLRVAAAQEPLPLPPSAGEQPAPATPETPTPPAETPPTPPTETPATPPPTPPPTPPLSPLLRPSKTGVGVELARAEEVYIVSGSTRSLSQNSVLLPEGDLELGGELTFLTSSVPPAGGEELVFTDVGLLMLNVRYSTGSVEIAAAADLLIKQPSFMDEWVPQAGSLTTRVALGEGQALSLNLEGGPLLRDLGVWEGAALVIQAKRAVHDTIVFEGALGGNFTHLNFDQPTQEAFWFSEVEVGLKVIFRTPFTAFAAWAGADLHVPVAGNPDSDAPDPAGFLDPSTRLNANIGAAYLVANRWNIYASLAVIDRGDKGNPESMLPILRGGFDQQHLTLGVQYRWELGRKMRMAE